MIVQTGPNTHPGGLNHGFSRLAYHSPGVVNMPMTSPMPTTATMNRRSESQFFMTPKRGIIKKVHQPANKPGGALAPPVSFPREGALEPDLQTELPARDVVAAFGTRQRELMRDLTMQAELAIPPVEACAEAETCLCTGVVGVKVDA